MTPVLIHVPSAPTLKKYGLDARTWLNILEAQGLVCAICRKVPKSGRFNTDHDHVRGWKKMKAERRREHVRGIVCHFCNRYYLGRCINVAKAENVLAYLRAFAARMEAGP